MKQEDNGSGQIFWSLSPDVMMSHLVVWSAWIQVRPWKTRNPTAASQSLSSGCGDTSSTLRASLHNVILSDWHGLRDKAKGKARTTWHEVEDDVTRESSCRLSPFLITLNGNSLCKLLSSPGPMRRIREWVLSSPLIRIHVAVARSFEAWVVSCMLPQSNWMVCEIWLRFNCISLTHMHLILLFWKISLTDLNEWIECCNQNADREWGRREGLVEVFEGYSREQRELTTASEGFHFLKWERRLWTTRWWGLETGPSLRLSYIISQRCFHLLLLKSNDYSFFIWLHSSIPRLIMMVCGPFRNQLNKLTSCTFSSRCIYSPTAAAKTQFKEKGDKFPEWIEIYFVLSCVEDKHRPSDPTERQKLLLYRRHNE